MHNRKVVLALMIMIPVILGLMISPSENSIESNNPRQDFNSDDVFDDTIEDVDTKDSFAVSQDTQEGIINPVQILESGFKETDPVRARTDTGTNTIQNITIDDDNEWVANYTSVEVSNIKRLYGVNGTFENGVKPWTNYTIAGGLDIQIADYDTDGEYIICRNVGNYKWQSKDTWVHSAGSEIGFTQVVYNTQGELEFNLRYDFRYATGPIDPLGNNALPPVVGAFYQVNYPSGSMYQGYYYPMNEYIYSREAWYSVAHTFTIPTAWSEFSFSVGLYLAGTITLDNVTDYDDDGSDGDGTVNAQNLTVYIDNVEFTGTAIPAFENVELTFHAGAFSDAITGSGIGTASISNPDYWIVDPLEIQITSNTTVAFTYSVTTLYLHLKNSSWTTFLSYQGVSFSINAGQNANLEYYTYVTTFSGYDNQTIEIRFPKDWDNTTIWDPLQDDITELCSLSTGRIFIPTSLFTRVGWWKITHQSLNYAKSIDVQIYDSSTWTTASLFRTSNLTRTQVELGTSIETPSSGSLTSINWIMPNGTIWFADSISSIVGGFVTSSQLTFGGMNTSAGQWEVQVFWNNGTEIAYGYSTFELYHSASATVKYPTLETDYGLVLSNQITLIDIDTGRYLLDDSVSMIANWSETTVEFSQNFAKNWWQAEFDSSLLENGRYTVIVEITRPYFNPITTQFTIISVFETSLEVLNAGLIPVERGLNEIFMVQLNYTLWNGTGISGAQPTVTSTSPQEGISWKNFVDNENGLYSIDIVANISATYEITIMLSKAYHYNSTDSFTLIINKTGTELELVNGTADVVQYGSSYRLIVEYRNSTGYGLSGADIQIVTITPGLGLSYVNFTPIYDGFYEATFTPSTTGTFSIVISASIFNHETQFTTFTLTGVVIPSVLTSLPSSTIIQVNQSFVLQLGFHDESLNAIDTATIAVINPPTGIVISSAVPIGNGLYNITVRSSQIDVYNLLFRATAPFYQSSIVGFTVSVTAMSTTMDILNAGSIPVENGLNEVFTVQLSYELLNGTGVSGAQYIVTFTGPENGLACNNFDDYNNGLYSFDIICNTSATYGVTVTLSKAQYYSATDSFVLIIGETGTELILMNGTADVVLFGDTYRLVIEYRNSTGYGLPDSTVQVVTVSPLTGLTYANFTHINDGYYEITLTPDIAGTFSVVISSSLINHETQYKTFTLTASGIPTILTSLPSEKTVAVNESYTLQLRFLDEDLTPINDANIILINPPAGLIFSSAVPIGNGIYNITLESFSIHTYDLLFRASKSNYQSSSAGFTLVVTEIQTSLSFKDDVTSATIPFSETYELIVYYERINPTGAVQGANITILSSDLTDLVIQVTEYSGYYTVSIKGFAIDSWILSVVAEKADHRTAIKQFRIEVAKINTDGDWSSPLEALLIGRSYIFNFSYIFRTNSTFIHGATITGTDEGADWISYLELSSGPYQVNLTPQGLGNHYVTLTFEKMGFETWSHRLSFTVKRVPIAVQVLEGLSAPELSESTLLVRLYETDTGQPVSGAQVRCSVIGPDEVSESYFMLETSTTGVYSAVILMPEAEGVYRLNITCDAANYVLNSAFTTQLQPARNVITMLWVATTRYYPFMLIFAAVSVGFVYRRSARKRRVRENKAALAVKRRFDDVKSLLGVIVLHKESGLPVYSKILREGLEETVISAFITAITSFRGEFDIESTSEEWGLIPISDIVRVISTNKLVCAFITTGNPSPEQRERMIQFAKTVGFIFDETMSDVPIVVLDQHTRMQFDSLFEDILDGALLRTYKLDEEKRLPTNTCANERIARKQGVEFKLEELASELAGCGLEEGRVYKAIMTALENHFLVTTDESPFASEIIRAPEEVSDES